MIFDTHAAILVLIMAVVTWLLRALPFMVFRKKVPGYILYLGEVLPAAIIGMLVVYCLREIQLTAAPFGLPELTAGTFVVMLHWWKRNSLISIVSGTILYMLLLHLY